MHIDGTWMFGSTRGSEPEYWGESIFVWLLDLDANYNPRADNLQVRKLDSGAFPGSSHISGMKPRKEGELLHMIAYNS